MAGDLSGFLLSGALNCERTISRGRENTGHYLIIISGFVSCNMLLKTTEEYFLKKNFIVFSYQYNALLHSNKKIAIVYLKKFITQFCTDKSKKIFFISYSNGCDVMMHYLNNSPSLSYSKIALINPPLNGLRFKVFINLLLSLFRFDVKNFDKFSRYLERLSNSYKIRIWKYGFNFLFKSKKSISLDVYQEYNSQKLIRKIYEYFIVK